MANRGGSSIQEATTKRGGKRDGSGPKRRSHSAAKVEELNERISDREKAEGKNIDDIALDILFDNGQRTIDRLKAYSILKEFSTIKAGEGGEADKELGPSVYLPEKRPDPAKVVPIK